jgi:hypothetical protein
VSNEKLQTKLRNGRITQTQFLKRVEIGEMSDAIICDLSVVVQIQLSERSKERDLREVAIRDLCCRQIQFLQRRTEVFEVMKTTAVDFCKTQIQRPEICEFGNVLERSIRNIRFKD